MSAHVTHEGEHGIVLYIDAGVIAPDDPGCWVKLGVGTAQRVANELSAALIAGGVLKGRGPAASGGPSNGPPTTACTQRKRKWPSEQAARLAHSAAGWRVHTYHCAACDGWHVANQDKGRMPGRLA